MAIQDSLDSPLARAVRKAGSQSAFARIVGRSQPSIFRDLSDNKPIALEDVPAIEKALGIPRHEQRPDYFEAPGSPSDLNPPQDPPGQPPAQGEGPASRPAETDNAGGSLSGSNSSDSDPLEGIAA